MGIILIGIGLILFGRIFWNVAYENDWEIINTIAYWLGGIILVISLFWGIGSIVDKTVTVITYTENAKYIESIKDNNQLTDSERKYARNLVMNSNKTIMRHRAWNNTFLVGIFHLDGIAELELIDIALIPKSKYQVGIDNN